MADSVLSSSKRPRLSSEEKHESNIDRISDLPDSVLCHILSVLPTVDSVATTILSKRCVDLWTQVPFLVFTSLFGQSHNDGSWFLNFCAMYCSCQMHEAFASLLLIGTFIQNLMTNTLGLGLEL
ncbi:hypothetical protein PTKIN_Ptkin02bG0212400 [Pterospermum kingtungense]